MRKLLVPLLTTLGLLAGAVTANAAPTSGVNDFSCAPSAQHRDPLPGGRRVALHLLYRHRRHLGAGAGGVEHHG